MTDLGERFCRCFALALDDADLPENPAFRATLRAYMRWAVDDVLSYSAAGSAVDPGKPMPRWGWDGLLADPGSLGRSAPSG